MKTLKNLSLAIILISSLTMSCVKKDDIVSPINKSNVNTDTTSANRPVLTTNQASNISFQTATCGGAILTDNGFTVVERGICVSVNATPTVNDTKIVSGAGMGSFSSDIISLNINTGYFVRAFARNEKGIAYGSAVYFKTLNVTAAPVVVTNAASNLAYNGATLNGSVSGDLVTERGFEVYNGSTLMGKVVVNSSSNDFSTIISNCVMNTNYSYRAYAINVVGTSYGSSVSFKTILAVMPSVNGAPLMGTQSGDIYIIDAACIITSDGGAPIIERGIVYKIGSEPTSITDGIKVTNNDLVTSVVEVKSSITLLKNQTVYVKAFATNSIGTSMSVVSTDTNYK